MIRAYVALGVLFASGFAAASSRGVTFVLKKAVDPCEDKVFLFRTFADGLTKIGHSFRMRWTDTLFTSSNMNSVPNWRQSATNGMDLSSELSFFHRQTEMLSSSFGDLLRRSVAVEPSYEFDSVSGRYIFQLFIGNSLVSMYAGDKVNYYPGYDRLETSVKSQVEKHNRGVGLDILQGDANSLGLKWRNICALLQTMENNATDEYSLDYDEKQSRLECSVRSKTPWRHLVLFGQAPATETKRSRDGETGEYTTSGFRVHDRRKTAVCNITSPNGMIALQTFEAKIPTTTPQAFETTVFFSTPSVEKDETTDDSFAPRTGTTTIVVPIVLVVAVILGGGLGVFVFRDRIERFVAGFRRVSTEAG